MDLQTLRNAYPDLSDEDGEYGLCSYAPIYNLFGAVVIEEHDQDYQGDSYILYRRPYRWAVLIFGWGSCSGCDSLQACLSWDDILEVANHLENTVIEFDSDEELIEWLDLREDSGSFYSYRNAWSDFDKKVRALLKNEPIQKELDNGQQATKASS